MMRILVPVDGSKPSQETLEWVLKIFNPQTTEIDILTVVPKNIPELQIDEYEIEDAISILKNDEKQISAKGFKVRRAEYVIGNPIQAICEYALTENVDQIIMGSHGRTGLAKLLLGSVSTGVFKNCKKPVFIYKSGAIEKAGFAG